MRWFAAVVSLLVFMGCLAGAENPGALLPLPEFPTAQVAIPWSELKALLEERRAPEKPEKLKEKPPVEWTIAEATYTARAETNAATRIEAAFDIYVWKPEGWTEIPLLAPSVAPIEITLDGAAAPLVNISGDMRGLVLESPGPHRIEAAFFAPLTAVEGVVTMDFPAAPAAINRVHLEVPVPDAIVQAPDAAGLTTARNESGVTAELAFRQAPNIAVSWRLPAKIEKAKPPEPPRLTCTMSVLAAVSERVLACDSMLAFSVQRGTTDTFAFTLPARVNVLQVEGQGAAWSRSEEQDLQRIEVKVNHPVEDQYTVVLRYELPGESELTTVSLPELVVLDVARQTGWVGIVARDNVEITPAPDITGYTRVDLSEIPGGLMALAANPILLAYRQNEPGGALALDVRKLADVPVRPATIDAAHYTTLLTKEGARMTRAVYEVRNNVQQYLRVRIGAEAKVSSASVGGRLVKPARDKDADTVLVPLQQSAIHGRELGAFPVEIVYTEPNIVLPKNRGNLDLALPAADLPIERASWEVWLPESHSAFDAAGDLTPDMPSALRVASGDNIEQARRTPKGTREVTIHRLREGIERFLITDINNPAGSAGGGGPRYVGGPVAELETGGAAVAGILPVAVELPLEGTPYSFSRIVIEENKPLGLTLSLYATEAAKRVTGAQLVLALMAGAAIGIVLRKRSMRNYAFATIAVVLLGALMAYGYPCGLFPWRSAITWAVLGLAVAIVPTVIPLIRRNATTALTPRTAAE